MQHQSQESSKITLAKCETIKIEDTFQEEQSIGSEMPSPIVNKHFHSAGDLSRITNAPCMTVALKSLLTDMSSLKSQFDLKWTFLLNYLDSLQIPLPGNKPKAKQVEQLDSVTQTIKNEDHFNGLDFAHQNFNNTMSIADDNKEEQSSPLFKKNQVNHQSSNMSKSTNMLIREQLNNQLKQAKEMIERDERAKLQLIEHIRVMHQEIQGLKQQLREQKEEVQEGENAIIVEEYSQSQGTVSKSEERVKNSLDESELVHFSVLPENYENGEIIVLDNNNGSSSREITINRRSCITNQTFTSISGQENVVETHQASYQIQQRIESLQSDEEQSNEEDLSLREDLQIDYQSQNQDKRKSTYQSGNTEYVQFNSQSLGKSISSQAQQLQPLSLILKNGINQQDQSEVQIFLNQYSEGKALKPKQSPSNYPLSKISPLSINHCQGYNSHLNFVPATPLHHQRPSTTSYQNNYRPMTERHSRNNTNGGCGIQYHHGIPNSKLLSITQLKNRMSEQQVTSIRPFAQNMEEMQNEESDIFEYGKIMRQAASRMNHPGGGENLIGDKKYMTNNQRAISEESFNGCLSHRPSQANLLQTKKSPQKMPKSPSTKKKREKENQVDLKPSQLLISNLKSPRQLAIYHQNRRPLKQSNKKSRLLGANKPCPSVLKDSMKVRDPYQRATLVLQAAGMYPQGAVKSSLQQSVSEVNFSPKRYGAQQAFSNTLRPAFSSHYLASPRTFGLNNL